MQLRTTVSFDQADHSLVGKLIRCRVRAFRSRSSTMKSVLLEDAVALIPSGATLKVGGFMGVGTPEALIDELVRQEKHDLVVIANDTASPGIGIGKLVGAKLLRKAVVSHIGLNPETQQQMMAGALHV